MGVTGGQDSFCVIPNAFSDFLDHDQLFAFGSISQMHHFPRALS